MKNAPPLPSFELDDASAPAAGHPSYTSEYAPASRSSFADATAPLSRGDRVAEKYLLVRHIGKGGMADVWEAQHEELRRSVAIKFLLPELLIDPAMTAAVLTRFRFEAQVSARLCERSRHIVNVYDFGSHRGQPYLVMELLPGRTLEDEITARGKLPAAEVATILDQAAHALRAAHDLGIVHRDLKPSNFLLAQDADGALLLKLTDFGVAKAVSNALAVDQPKQTTAGSLVGSPAFMSPEQVDDRPLDARSDIWSLGAVVYEALSGSACFEGPSLMRVLARIASRQIVPIRERVPELPPTIDGWFDRALSLDVAGRFADVEEMAAAFRAAVATPRAPVAVRSPKAFAIGALLALVAAIGVGILVRVFSSPAAGAPHTAETSSPHIAEAPSPPSAPTAAQSAASEAPATATGAAVQSATRGAQSAAHSASPSAAPSAPAASVSATPAPASASSSPRSHRRGTRRRGSIPVSISRTVALAALLAAAVVSAPSVSRADENDSKTFFAQGRKLRAANNCNDAITAFQRALDLWPQGLGALRNIAECEEQLGHYASARNSYWSLRRAVLQSNDPHYENWDKEAEAAYDRLAVKVAKITVKIEGAAPEVVQISIDGKPLDPRLVGVALERDLGAHELELRYGGVTPLIEKRTLAAGSNEVVTFKVPAKGTLPTASPSASARATAAPEVSHFPYRPLMIGSFALGAVGVIGAGIAAGVFQSARSSIDSKCTKIDDSHFTCPSDLKPQQQQGATAATLFNVFTVAAVVGAGAGVALWIATPSSSAPAATTKPQGGAKPAAARKPSTTEIGFSPSLHGGMIFARGSF